MVAYALSFAQVGIYWNNHHRLFESANRATVRLRWANMVWMFATSLIPFGTAYWGEHPGEAIPTAVYLLTLLLPALVYPWLEAEALCDVPARGPSQRKAERRKIMASLALYCLGFVLAFVYAPASLVCAFVVGLFWLAPGGRIDRCFGAY